MLVVAFLGWLCAGVHMSITQLTGQAAAIDLLGRAGELDAARFQALNKQAERKKGSRAVSPSDAAQVEDVEDRWSAGGSRGTSARSCSGRRPADWCSAGSATASAGQGDGG